MPQLNTNIFNTRRDYHDRSLFLGERPGLFDTVNKHHPKIWSLYKEMKNNDWDENEFDYSSCNIEFKNCERNDYEMMIRTLGWQWETDSVASNSIISIMSPFISSSELTAAWTRVTDNEVTHAATYSEIVRNSFDNPREVLDQILSVSESLKRLTVVTDVMGRVHQVSHEYAAGLRENNQDTYNHAFLFTAALLMMERIQFMASFAVTFTICDTGLFQPIGKAVQKIAQDELEVHVELDKAILRNELQTPRGQVAYRQLRPQLQVLADEIVASELVWIRDGLFSDGRQLVGMTPDLLSKWMLYNARDVYDFLSLDSTYPMPEKNPLLFMNNWLNISKNQPAPQEEQIGQYRVNIMRRTDDNVIFDADF